MLGAGGADDNEEGNVEAARQAERRQKRLSATNTQRGKQPRRGSSVDADDDRPILKTKSAHKEKSKKRSRDESDSDSDFRAEVVDSDDDDGKRPSRYKPRHASTLLTEWNFDLIRPEA